MKSFLDCLDVPLRLPMLWMLMWALTSLTNRAAQQGEFFYEDVGPGIRITGYTDRGGAVAIPDTIAGKPVTFIGNTAFGNHRGITSVTIPNSVTLIGQNAFEHCTGLTSVSIGNNVTLIGGGAFYGCTGLRSLVIPNSVTDIGDSAFRDCRGLTSVSIGKSLTTIGAGAFWDCGALSSISVEPLNPNYSSLDGVLFNKTQTTLIQYPGGRIGNFAIPDSVTEIGRYAFLRCAGLSGVSIGNNITIIGDGSFSGCTGLSSVSIPNSVTAIGHSAFESGPGLTSISVEPLNSAYSSLDGVLFDKNKTTLIQFPRGKTGSYTVPGSVISISDRAFLGCAGLSNVNIGNSVASIGELAFINCTGLSSLAIPGSVTSIGEYAFYSCTGLTSLNIPSSVMFVHYSAFQECTRLARVTVPEIGIFSALNGGSITMMAYTGGAGAVTIPGSVAGKPVTAIESLAFKDHTGLTSVTIPSTVTEIRDRAFQGCTALTNVTIPISGSFISESAFADCPSLSSVTIPGTGVFGVLNGASITISGYRGSGGALTIPGSLLGKPVTAMGSFALRDHPDLTKVVIPSSVTSIGAGAFSGCASLRIIYFRGDAPGLDGPLFEDETTAAIFYDPDTVGWGSTFAGRPALLWEGTDDHDPTAPSISGMPASRTVREGQSTSFYVAATGFPLHYQWRKDGIDIPEATGAAFNLGPAQTRHAGEYSVVVTNSLGSVTSAAPVILTVAPAPPAGAVVGWGNNDSGQIIAPAAASTGVTSIVGGEAGSIALTSSGGVVFWGNNDTGLAEVPEAAKRGVAAIALGYYLAAALKTNGSMVVWGHYGGNSDPFGDPPAEANSGIAAIAVQGGSAFALKQDGSVVVFNDRGEVFSAGVSAREGVIAMALGYSDRCFLKGDGSVRQQWYHERFGIMETTVVTNGAIAIAAGSYHGLALMEDSSVVAWGSNGLGQADVPEAAKNGVVAIAAGGFHSLALKADGTVIAWGDNSKNQSSVPVGLSGVTAIAAGGLHSLALVGAAAVLNVKASGDEFVLSWRDATAGFALESTADFSDPDAWGLVLQIPRQEDGMFKVALPLLSSPRFFRLVKN